MPPGARSLGDGAAGHTHLPLSLSPSVDPGPGQVAAVLWLTSALSSRNTTARLSDPLPGHRPPSQGHQHHPGTSSRLHAPSGALWEPAPGDKMLPQGLPHARMDTWTMNHGQERCQGWPLKTIPELLSGVPLQGPAHTAHALQEAVPSTPQPHGGFRPPQTNSQHRTQRPDLQCRVQG